MKISNPFKKKRYICLVKVSAITVDGTETTYHTEIDGRYIHNSVFTNRTQAEAFYDRAVKREGKVESTEILKTHIL